MASQAEQYINGSGIARVGALNESTYQALLEEWMRRFDEVKEERDAYRDRCETQNESLARAKAEALEDAARSFTPDVGDRLRHMAWKLYKQAHKEGG